MRKENQNISDKKGKWISIRSLVPDLWKTNYTYVIYYLFLVVVLSYRSYFQLKTHKNKNEAVYSLKTKRQTTMQWAKVLSLQFMSLMLLSINIKFVSTPRSYVLYSYTSRRSYKQDSERQYMPLNLQSLPEDSRFSLSSSSSKVSR